MKYAKFSDDFLSDFRLDDNGETLVLTDKRGFTRAVRLLPYEERLQGEWIITHHKDILGRWNSWYEYKCSACKLSISQMYDDAYGEYATKFCPNCGACMQKGGVE